MKHKFLYYVTGTFHGAHVYAETEGEARKTFHAAYNGESIVHLSQANKLWKFII